MPAILVDKIFPTITWTLVHSLWQGLILTVLAGLVLLSTRRSTASLRYMLLCSLFFLFLGGVAFTFVWELTHDFESVEKYSVAAQVSSFPLFSNSDWPTSIVIFLNENAQWIVLTWLLMLLFRSARMLREILCIRELRNRKNFSAEPLWITKLQGLAKELGIHKTVALVESAVVKVPIVVGYLKPLVMVPVGMFNHLSPGEAEAVLLHELAHIRRHDYLVNYMQRIAEAILFFNPGMLWVSSLMRTEREACCDEMAIDRTGNKQQFVEALIRCKEHALETPAFSLGLFGNKNILLQRLNRIVSNRNKSLSLFEGSFFVISAVVLLTIFSGWTDRTKLPGTVGSAPALKTSSSFSELAQIKEQPLQIEITQVKANQKALLHKEISQRHIAQRKNKQKREVVSNINIDQLKPESDNHMLQQVAQLDDHLTTQHDVEHREAEMRRFQMDRNRMEMERARHQAEIDRTQAELDRKHAEREREKINQYREQAQRDRLHAERDRIEIQKIREQQNRNRPWTPQPLQ